MWRYLLFPRFHHEKFELLFPLLWNIDSKLEIEGPSRKLESDFKKIGIKEHKQLVRFIFDVISNQIGVNTQDPQFQYQLAYKLEFDNNIEYLILGLNSNGDKSIWSAYLADDALKREFNTKQEYMIFNKIIPCMALVHECKFYRMPLV